MEPVSLVGTILKLLQEIAKAARTARRNRTRCQELAWRAKAVGNVLRASMAGARSDAARSNMLCRLKEALDDALQLVESCRRPGGVFSWIRGTLTSGSKAARFEDVERRITTCLVDLGAATSVSMESKIDKLASARDRRPRKNKPKQKQIDAGNAPPKGTSKNDKIGGRSINGGQNGERAANGGEGRRPGRRRRSPTGAFLPTRTGMATPTLSITTPLRRIPPPAP